MLIKIKKWKNDLIETFQIMMVSLLLYMIFNKYFFKLDDGERTGHNKNCTKDLE